MRKAILITVIGVILIGIIGGIISFYPRDAGPELVEGTAVMTKADLLELLPTLPTKEAVELEYAIDHINTTIGCRKAEKRDNVLIESEVDFVCPGIFQEEDNFLVCYRDEPDNKSRHSDIIIGMVNSHTDTIAKIKSYEWKSYNKSIKICDALEIVDILPPDRILEAVR